MQRKPAPDLGWAFSLSTWLTFPAAGLKWKRVFTYGLLGKNVNMRWESPGSGGGDQGASGPARSEAPWEAP